mmetsp:Transcript_52022/g.165899  ORF Transcript_52022/g.165899 Transcript_52022/m.165899 type:complete len:179 (-) Transcript_52022:282-818(-)|eukprot:CAMPEP_0182899118 /NCGR_PEP_ID=MMETSP0034_2-20130328/27884_1 /TAXON_ID=156128 /ORGANISM="Nephroselmis pyriformis, Strain CCMP717" /LENGTH=178 /DNA_ID=CAMNT_0025033123 /DNA_START=205 /DNA_END=741 /DNA_ORIENTATION=-
MVAITLQTSFVGARSAVLAKGRQTSCMAPASSGRAVPARARRASLSVSAKSVPGVGLMMTRKPVCCKPGDSVDDAAGVLLGGSFSHLPVVDADGKLVGVLSESDLLFTGDLTSQYEEDNIKSDAKTVEDAMVRAAALARALATSLSVLCASARRDESIGAPRPLPRGRLSRSGSHMSL